MATAKLSMLMIPGAAVPFLIEASAQYALSPLPSLWIGKAALGNVRSGPGR